MLRDRPKTVSCLEANPSIVQIREKPSLPGGGEGMVVPCLA